MLFVLVIANSFQTGAREDVWDGTRTFYFVCQCVHKTVKYLIFQNHHMHEVKSISKRSLQAWGYWSLATENKSFKVLQKPSSGVPFIS